MKLEFEQDFVTNALNRELDFRLFLDLFDLNIPLIPSKILRPMDKQSGIAHFTALSEVASFFTGQQIKVLTEESGELPNLDELMPFFQSGTLEQYHLFELGRFLMVNKRLVHQEKKFALASGLDGYLNEMYTLLSEYTRDNFSSFLAGDDQAPIQQAMDEVNAGLKKKLLEYEDKIFKATGLKMIYPYPKEVHISPGRAEKIRKTELLSVVNQDDIFHIDYQPGQTIRDLVKKQDQLVAQLSCLMEKKLGELNLRLLPFYQGFKKYYDLRKKRTWRYAILFVKNSWGFALPSFTANRCTIKKGYVFGLKQRKKEKCIPLDITLDQGANVLYGANMSGKTTVLKTVYFLLTLVRAGLPIPAQALEIDYPEDLSILLKSSGDLHSDISSFGEEICFLTSSRSKKGYLLCDELFLSTDPVNGARLSRIFIQEFAHSDMFFFCSTHYPQVLDIPGIGLLRMQDPNLACLAKQKIDLDHLQKIMPYRVEQICGDVGESAVSQDLTPLHIALLFDLPHGIKEKIRQKIDEFTGDGFENKQLHLREKPKKN